MCHTLRRGRALAFTRAAPLQLAHLHAFPSATGAVLLTLPLQEKWLAQQSQLASLRATLPTTRLAGHGTDGRQMHFVYTQDYLNHLFEHTPRYQQLLFWARMTLYCNLLVRLSNKQHNAMPTSSLTTLPSEITHRICVPLSLLCIVIVHCHPSSYVKRYDHLTPPLIY